MYVYTRERDTRPGFDGVKIKFYYYYYIVTSKILTTASSNHLHNFDM